MSVNGHKPQTAPKPVISGRVHQELKDRLLQVKEAKGCGLGEILEPVIELGLPLYLLLYPIEGEQGAEVTVALRAWLIGRLSGETKRAI